MELLLLMVISLLVIAAINATSPFREISPFVAVALFIIIVAVQLAPANPFFTMTDNFTDNTCEITAGTASISMFKHRTTSFTINQPCSDSIREQMKPMIDGYRKRVNILNTGEK